LKLPKSKIRRISIELKKLKNKQKLKFSIFEKLIHEIVEDFAVQKFKEFETSPQSGGPSYKTFPL
jgi:hypothetical protein